MAELPIKVPFPDWPARPLADECEAVVQALAPLHGIPKPSNTVKLEDDCNTDGWSVLDSLIRTILSQNTTDKTSIKAFNTLKQRFPTWEQVLQAPNEEIEDAIRVGGLAAIKTNRIKDILAAVLEEQGKCSLEHLHSMSTEEIKTYFSKFKGVGPKTVSCVLMFSLNRHDFPVDVHVHRISKQLGWIPEKATREQAYLHLNSRVPPHLMYPLHIQLVEHGKVCGACSGGGKGKKLDVCPLKQFKKKARKAATSAVKDEEKSQVKRAKIGE